MSSTKIKNKLLSMYSAAPPQVFTQLHVTFDEDRHKIDTETTRVYDLRAGAVVQILIADGMSKETAIEFLQAAVRHLEVMGLPHGAAPILYPDGTDAQ